MKCKKVSLLILFALMLVMLGINTATASMSVKVSANPLWTNTGVEISKGQIVHITASGTWTDGVQWSGPEGYGEYGGWNHFLTYPPSTSGELIAFVGNNIDPYQGQWGNDSFFPQPVGEGYWAVGNNTSFTSDRNGKLWLGINDDSFTTWGVSDNSGSLVAVITVNNVTLKPIPAFIASPTSGSIPLKVQFTDQSTGSPTSWYWVFGDGTTSTTQNPLHTYIKAGSLTVTLTATNGAGSSKVTKTAYINVILKPPVAAFKATPLSGKKPLTVSFTDQSTNNPTSWSWVFGDGTSSSVKNPVHKYTKAGTYSVKLTVKNAAGSSSVTKSKYIIVK